MPYSTLRFEVRERVAYITLDRPDAANTLSAEMARDLLAAATACERDHDVRVVVITGAGKAFCAGGDLKSFAAAFDTGGEELGAVLAGLHEAILKLTRMTPPVIAAVNGVAAGAGVSLACACDLIVAAESARFTVAYTRAGLSPDGSCTYFLPRRIGLGRALELTLTNRMLAAREALEWGMVNRIVPDADLMTETTRLATELANGAPLALGAAKRLLRVSATVSLEEQLEREADSIVELAQSADGHEGIEAFVAKRAPMFEGR